MKNDFSLLSLAFFNLFFKQKTFIKNPYPTDLLPPISNLSQSSIPSSKTSRLLSYSSLAISLSVSSLFSNQKVALSSVVGKLLKMRGAVLKVGQMFSIQDMFTPEMAEIWKKVRDGANYMTQSQFNMVIESELGSEWREKFSKFELKPFAAASIGQVHFATINILPGTGEYIGDRSVPGVIEIPVAVKIQYPGVAESIDSDLTYLKTLANMSLFLPKGMFLSNTLRVAKLELEQECDYLRELQSTLRFQTLLNGYEGFNVPAAIPELSTSKIIVTRFVKGIPVGDLQVSQEIRDSIGARLLRLCLDELFRFGVMQTDPNWANFLYNTELDIIHLIDFGSTREFSKSFTDRYLALLKNAALQNRDLCTELSIELGFLTGHESPNMLNAHLNSLFMLAEPFRYPGKFDFGGQGITGNVRNEIGVILKERLTPPPDESYSLHRKLSGCFLLCAKLGARVNCHEIFKLYAN